MESSLKCSDPSKYDINHGVTLVGYGVKGPNDKGTCQAYWIVRNSWGTDWGENGFFRLCMDGAGSGNTPYGTC